MSARLALSTAATVGCLVAFATAAPAPPAHPAVTASRATALVAGSTIERAIPQGKTHSYSIRLAVGNVLHVAVLQRGADVRLALRYPASRELLEVDSPNGVGGMEDLFAVAEVGGDYLLEIEDTEGTGGYRLHVDPLHAATAADRRRAAAAEALWEGDHHRLACGPGELARASTSYRRALRLAARAGDVERGSLARYRLGQVAERRKRYAEALDHLMPLSRAWRDRWEGDALLDAIGLAFERSGKAEAALRFYRLSADQARRLGDERGWSVAIGNQAEVYRLRGQYRTALDLEDGAWWRMADLRLDEERAKSVARIAHIRLSVGDYAKAVEESEAALAMLRQDVSRAQALQVESTAEVGLKNWPQAARGFAEAKGFAHGCDPADEIAAANGLGFVKLQQHQLKEAAAVLEWARRTAHAAHDPGEGNALGNLGATYSEMGDTERGLACFTRAGQIYGRLRDSEAVAAVLFGTAEAYERSGRLAEAQRAIARSLRQIESLRTRPAGSDFRQFFFASRQDEYDLAIHIWMELDEKEPGLGYAERAFEVAERTRARSLLDELAIPRQGEESVSALKAQETELKETLRRLSASRAAAASAAADSSSAGAASARLASLDEGIDQLGSQLAEIDGQLRQRQAVASALPGPQPLSLREIQRQVLDGDTLLLAYSLGTPESFLWAVDRSSIRAYRLPGRQQIDDLAQRTYDGFRSSLKLTRRQAAGDAAELSRLVLGPVANELRGRPLAIVADGALQYIPFAALPDPVALAAGAGDDPPPLLMTHEIVHLPSVSLLAPLRRRVAARTPPTKLIAALGDPVFEADDTRLTAPAAGKAAGISRRAAPHGVRAGEENDVVRSARDVDLDHLVRLPGTDREVRAILKLAPLGSGSFAATGFDATRELAVSPELRRYRYLQLATHGLLDTLHPELSGLVFSRFDQRDRPRDGFLHAYELPDLRLSADLVVLSACQTALGAQIRGEGLMGLTRGFMDAGVPRVVVSLWDADDSSTAVLMEELYRGLLSKRLSPAAALRAAQIAVRNGGGQRKAPYYWAAFVLQGDWR